MKLFPNFSRIAAAAAILTATGVVAAHDGPPFPIVSNQTAGNYDVSVWTDPDTTDDGSPKGQFWIVVEPRAASELLPAATRALVSIQPADRPGPVRMGWTEPVRGEPTRRFAALLMDHEGLFNVRVTLEGPLGHAEVESEVEATYDLRPPPFLLGLYVVPFLLAGFLWLKLLLRRRRSPSPGAP